ncbi:hypothetical protein DL771_010503 [Monosporascus sp. 5C6A]|nr:hypothetical protein DL771_010503 [Monosporascus sp. 5C6A]
MDPRRAQPGTPSSRVKNWIDDAAAKVRDKILSSKGSPPESQEFHTANPNSSISSFIENSGIVSPHISSASASERGDNDWEMLEPSNSKKTSQRQQKKATKIANDTIDNVDDMFKPTMEGSMMRSLIRDQLDSPCSEDEEEKNAIEPTKLRPRRRPFAEYVKSAEPDSSKCKVNDKQVEETIMTAVQQFVTEKLTAGQADTDKEWEVLNNH